jgi:hypothetical protein
MISNEALRKLFEDDLTARSTIAPDLGFFRHKYTNRNTEMQWRGFEAAWRLSEKRHAS